MSKNRHIYELDYVRALSVMMIVLYHYTTRYDESIGHLGKWLFLLPWGCYAVNTFFLLTGFLTVKNLNVGGIKFICKRIIRLYPTYWCGIILTSLAMFFLLPDRLRTMKDILLNFTMLQSYLGIPHVDGVYWTLVVEMIFYIIIFLLMLIKDKKKILAGMYAWMTLAMYALISENMGITNLIVKCCNYFLVTDKRAEFFVVGTVVAYAIEGKKTVSILPLALMCYINAFLDIGFVHGVLWMMIWSGIIWLFASESLHIHITPQNWIHRFLCFIAGISYPMYLIHQNIGYGIIYNLEMRGMVSEIWIVIPVGICILLAYLLHKCVEIPVGNRFSKYILRR